MRIPSLTLSLFGLWALLVCAIHSTAVGGPIEDAAKSVVLIRTPEGLGTGFVVQDRSLIATNFHVIDGADEAKVEFPDGETISVKGFLVASPGYDLAILKLSEPAKAAPMRLSNSRPDLGEEVFTVGSPKGLAGSVSKGVVSAHRRWSDLKPLLGSALGDFGYEPQSNWIQTDAAINNGNSGGPLVVETGEVVAVNTLASPASVGQNINFAVSVAHLTDFLDKLPNTSMPLAELPRSPKKRDLPKGDDAAATLVYWTGISKVVGNEMYAHKQLEIKAGLFQVSGKRVAAGNGNRDKAWEADPKFGKTQYDRERRLYRMAADAEVPIAEAQRLTFDELRRKGQAAKRADANQREKHRQNQAMLNGLPPIVIAAISQREQSEKINKTFAEIEELMGSRADLANTAARMLELVPPAGANKAVVSFSTDLAAAFRRYALACGRLKTLCPLIKKGTANADFDDALAQRSIAEQQLMELRDVAGGEIRTRLQNMYSVQFGPLAALTAEQLVIFDGKRVER
jgi:S1-C subfamily serine protease